MPQVKPQIVLVDDDALAAHYYRTVLATANLEPVVCYGGRQAWEWLQRHPNPPLLITDIEMPGCDGWALVERIRNDRRFEGLPVIVMVDFVEPNDHRRAYRLRARLLTKGETSPQELVRTVRTILGKSSVGEENGYF